MDAPSPFKELMEHQRVIDEAFSQPVVDIARARDLLKKKRRLRRMVEIYLTPSGNGGSRNA